VRVAELGERPAESARDLEPDRVGRGAAAQQAKLLAQKWVARREHHVAMRGERDAGDQAHGHPHQLPERVARLVGVARRLEGGDGARERLGRAGDRGGAQRGVESRQRRPLRGDAGGGAEGRGQLERGRVAIARLLGHRFRDDLVERGRQAVAERRHRSARVQRLQLLARRRAKRQPPRQRLVGDDAERVDVGA
jgi:hypothetical protein